MFFMCMLCHDFPAVSFFFQSIVFLLTFPCLDWHNYIVLQPHGNWPKFTKHVCHLPGSESDYSYRSAHSAGGTRRDFRKKKNADGTYGAEEEYDENADAAGMKRRQLRREVRKQAAIKEKKKALARGKRDGDSDGSEYSYRSVVSAGGTRHVMRRKRNADGTYDAEESYHSSQDEDGEARRKKRRAKRLDDIKKGKRNADSDSDYSYRSVRSAGGTRKVLRRKKNKDGTYGKEEAYDSDKDIDGKERRRARREQRQLAFKAGKRRDDSDSDYSYRSLRSAGGTRHVMRRRKRGDGTYSAEHSYHSSDDEEGDARRRRRRRNRKHAGSAHRCGISFHICWHPFL